MGWLFVWQIQELSEFIWSGRWESNPRHKLGKLGYYHYTTPALAHRPCVWVSDAELYAAFGFDSMPRVLKEPASGSKVPIAAFVEQQGGDVGVDAETFHMADEDQVVATGVVVFVAYFKVGVAVG